MSIVLILWGVISIDRVNDAFTRYPQDNLAVISGLSGASSSQAGGAPPPSHLGSVEMGPGPIKRPRPADRPDLTQPLHVDVEVKRVSSDPVMFFTQFNFCYKFDIFCSNSVIFLIIGLNIIFLLYSCIFFIFLSYVLQEPAYTPQVEAISPILPQEDPANKILREELLANIDKVDREMVNVEQQISKLKKKQVGRNVNSYHCLGSKVINLMCKNWTRSSNNWMLMQLTCSLNCIVVIVFACFN